MWVDPATEIDRRSNQNFPPPPEVVTVDPASGLIDRELYGDEDLKIALFRLFLEPLGVAVDTWSMSVQSFETGAERNLTYTFGDLLLAQYIPRITAKLEADLGGAMTCPQLSAASIKQYVRPS